MRHALLNDKVYKSLRYALIVVGIIILILPWMNQKQLNYWLIGLYLFMLGDWLCTFLQHCSVNVLIGLLIGYIVAIIVCFLLLFYTISINN
ncbi:hypothetical protein B5E44_05350 [Lactobacillus gallinarum]|uniref:Uncharacterized protein n=1 Tax=Lactobacillus gallinarum TaxID=52242 RepID=A0A1Y4UF47_9LACO|nr:hypothetical protein B5E59_05145 [Lactobacillus gallinarum]OUQ76335.1 hypothetical protein B5E44_05350 [Lactobacillus gallinarum]